ncbi:MAG: hypothetical protein V1867_02325 [Candidatus Falkowbacteria bacterium]
MSTKSRIKFDKTLGVHLVDIKPKQIGKVERIKTKRGKDEMTTIVENWIPSIAPPVTLLMAPVGVGKSTYLKHFELVSGKKIIQEKTANWIYVDFEEMGGTGNVRIFLYKIINNYLLKNCDHTDIENAYKDEIKGLKAGLFARKDEKDFNDEVTEHIKRDYEKIEPYVDKMLKYLSTKNLTVIILDNIDLYSDDKLEETVLSEGLAFSKRVCCHIIISIRDSTFIKHKSSSLFDAYELRQLWLDPPPFREVLSKRLLLSKELTRNKKVKISFSNGINLDVPNLGVFFEIAQKNLLAGKSGDFIESFSYLNVRKGINLIKNFLTSGHINANLALLNYINKSEIYEFPFQEVFKGSVLSYWMYYKENRTNYCLNLFDSKFKSKNLQLLRMFIVAHLCSSAKSEKTAHVSIRQLDEIFSHIGASTDQIIETVKELINYDLAKSADSNLITKESSINITRTGAYYYNILSYRMVYIEMCLYDTSIYNQEFWNKISSTTQIIEREKSEAKRMMIRKRRLENFCDYLISIEKQSTKHISGFAYLCHSEHLKRVAINEVNIAIRGAIKKEYFARTKKLFTKKIF